MLFKNLPVGAKKSLIQYFVLDCYDDDFNKITENINDNEISDSHWNLLIEKANILWGERNYSLSSLPIDVTKDFIMKYSTDLLDEYESFDDYHNEYYGDGDHIPNHKDNSFPVLAMPSCDEALIDGWHRLHSYVKNGFDRVYFINLDKESKYINQSYAVHFSGECY